MLKLAKILNFLKMVSDEFDGIWVNDYQNMNTEQGKMYQYCLRSKLIETTWKEDASDYGETYAEVSDLGYELLDLNHQVNNAESVQYQTN